jgi:hypothetical protein
MKRMNVKEEEGKKGKKEKKSEASLMTIPFFFPFNFFFAMMIIR